MGYAAQMGVMDGARDFDQDRGGGAATSGVGPAAPNELLDSPPVEQLQPE